MNCPIVYPFLESHLALFVAKVIKILLLAHIFVTKSNENNYFLYKHRNRLLKVSILHLNNTMFKAPQPTKDEITIIAARPNVHLIAKIIIKYEKEHCPIEKAT